MNTTRLPTIEEILTYSDAEIAELEDQLRPLVKLVHRLAAVQSPPREEPEPARPVRVPALPNSDIEATPIVNEEL